MQPVIRKSIQRTVLQPFGKFAERANPLFMTAFALHILFRKYINAEKLNHEEIQQQLIVKTSLVRRAGGGRFLFAFRHFQHSPAVHIFSGTLLRSGVPEMYRFLFGLLRDCWSR